MEGASSPIKTTYDTTPATLGDLDIWGGRLMEIIDEAKEELKAEFNQRMDTSDAHQIQMQDTLADHTLLLKAIDKKLSKN